MRVTIRRSSLAAVWSCLLLNTATAQLRDIEANNPQLRAARTVNAAMMADLQTENRPGATRVEYSPFYQSGYDGVASSELIVEQETDFPTLYAARSRQNAAQRQVLDLQYSMQRRDIMLEAAKCCIDLQTARLRHQLLAARLGAADTLLATVQRRLDEGDATRIDLNRVKMDRMAARSEAVRCDAEMADLRLTLQRLNGGKPYDEQAPDPWLDRLTAPVTPDGEATLETTLAEASLQATERELSVARQSWLPSLSIGYRRNTDHGDAQNGLLLGMALPLWSNAGKVKAAKLRRSAAEDLLMNTRCEQDARMTSLLRQATQLQLVLETYDEDLMTQTLQLLQRAVMAGELTVSEYYTEANRIYDLQLARLSALNEYRKTVAEIHAGKGL